MNIFNINMYILYMHTYCTDIQTYRHTAGQMKFENADGDDNGHKTLATITWRQP